jgi:hypothetical protein
LLGCQSALFSFTDLSQALDESIFLGLVSDASWVELWDTNASSIIVGNAEDKAVAFYPMDSGGNGVTTPPSIAVDRKFHDRMEHQ